MDTSSEVSVQRDEIVNLIISCVRDVLEMRDGLEPSLAAIGEETRLIGQGAIFDSLGLISLIVEVEQRLADNLNLTLILADEHAMSQKRSPFRSVGSLADYICLLVAEQDLHVGR